MSRLNQTKARKQLRRERRIVGYANGGFVRESGQPMPEWDCAPVKPHMDLLDGLGVKVFKTSIIADKVIRNSNRATFFEVFYLGPVTLGSFLGSQRANRAL